MAMVKKSAEAFRTISEVAEILDIPAHVLRFWESRFTQIKPTKRGGGRRYYRPNDIDLLRGIRDLLYGEGLTIKGVQQILREQGVKHVAGLGHVDMAELTTDAPPAAVTVVATPDPAPSPTEPPVSAPPQAVTVATAPDPAVEVPDEQPAPSRRPALRIVQPADAEPEEMQIDLFAHADNRERRPFPPDPATASRREEIRTIVGKLKQLRTRMVAG